MSGNFGSPEYLTRDRRWYGFTGERTRLVYRIGSDSTKIFRLANIIPKQNRGACLVDFRVRRYRRAAVIIEM